MKAKTYETSSLGPAVSCAITRRQPDFGVALTVCCQKDRQGPGRRKMQGRYHVESLYI